MEQEVFSVGSRVRVTSSGPFRGLKGQSARFIVFPPVRIPGGSTRLSWKGPTLRNRFGLASRKWSWFPLPNRAQHNRTDPLPLTAYCQGNREGDTEGDEQEAI
jgi:hypothetical protein